MLFNSYEFLFYFLPLCLGLSILIFRLWGQKALNIWLIVASLFFYSWHKVSDIWIIIGSILFNYGIVYALANLKKNRKLVLTFVIIVNLSLLFYFKYLDFISNSLAWILSDDFLALIHKRQLPLAISFFTFQQISFIVDQYRKTDGTKVGFITYATSVLFFPHLIAGPLVEYAKLIPQFQSQKKYKKFSLGILLGLVVFIIGLSKKTIIADSLAPFVIKVFSSDYLQSGLIHFSTVWLGLLSYTFQLYFDFSGYSDMAVGLALMFGIRLPFNFNSPYKARNIIDFWRRWHISLSEFLKNYLYIPLGGSRGPKWLKYRNLLITMVLGGIWHGAGWNFLIWGFWHGTALVINHAWQNRKAGRKQEVGKFKKSLSYIFTFFIVMLGWVFFRAESTADSFIFFQKLFDFGGIVTPGTFAFFNQFKISFYFLAFSMVAVFVLPNSIYWLKYLKYFLYKKAYSRGNRSLIVVFALVITLAVLLTMCLFQMSNQKTFIYYQF